MTRKQRLGEALVLGTLLKGQRTHEEQREAARAAAVAKRALAVFDCYAALRGATFTREGALAKLKTLGCRREESEAAADQYEPTRTGLQPAPTQATSCTSCGQHVSLTEDWTLWPWPDGAQLCSTCNDERHEREEYKG